MKKYFYFSFLVLMILAAMLLIRLKAQQCDTQQASVVGYQGGDDSTIDLMDGVSNDVSNMHLRLRALGANFVATRNYNVTTNKRMTGAAADFNNDGKYDLIQGGRGCDYNTNSELGNLDPNDSNLSIFISQGKDQSDINRFKFDGPYYILYEGTTLDKTYEIIALGAGDYDGDGDADFAALSWQGRLFIFKNLFIENGLEEGDVPVFSNTLTYLGDLINDDYTEWGQSSSHWRWESNIASVDVDGDSDLDLIVGVPSRWAGYRWGEVVIYINNGTGTFSRLSTSINPYTYTNDSYRYGVCGVAAADFDNDGDADFYVGSANSIYLYYYRNDGVGGFKSVSSRRITIPSDHGSCSMLRAADLDCDGDADFVLSTDGRAGTNTPGGYVYWYENRGTDFTSRCVPSDCSQVSSSGDFDSGDVGDFDDDQDIDFFVADGNDSLSCYFFVNDIFPIYVERGTVISKNRLPCSFIESDNAVVSATITVQETLPAGTRITYYLSNSNDENGNPLWEGPVTPGVEFNFASPGVFLRWKAVLETTNINQTPKIHNLSIQYEYITKREYSRTSHAFTQAEVNAGTDGLENVLYSASFEFPTWRGHLRSWDVTTLTLTFTRNSELKDIVDAGADYIADAGERLATRDYSTRIVYTAYDAEGDGKMNDRLDFNVSNKSELEPYLMLGEGSPETEPLIKFVLGYNRSWKLGDINHSSPQALEPPAGNPTLMGDGYSDFKEAHKNRERAILVGANDGMIHCFDPASMDELWAFIPNNLLYKLKKMRVKDAQCGEYLFHHFFVDGTPVIQDVYFNNAWHTVLVCGQGAGWGKGHMFYYFCLDVTDPRAPQPLWEITDVTMGETWSVPIIGRVSIGGNPTWVAFMGSGYDSYDPDTKSGDHFYAVDVGTGAILKSFEIKDNPEPTSPFGIVNTIPGSPNIVDKNHDGLDDYVYFGDLLGRFWRIDVTTDVNQWNADVIYSDPYYHPIITKPAFYVSTSDNIIHLYFGTGGDERAPSDAYYSFIALRDGITSTSVEWFMGPDELATRLGISTNLKRGEFELGEKVWADDVIADRRVYIATLKGNIENLNPCLTLAGSGRIYSRYIQGSQAGGSALTGAGGDTVESLLTAQKVRSAVTVGNIQRIEQGDQTLSKRLVFIQSYTEPGEGGPQPPSQVLAQLVTNSRLVIKSWREMYKIIR